MERTPAYVADMLAAARELAEIVAGVELSAFLADPVLADLPGLTKALEVWLQQQGGARG